MPVGGGEVQHRDSVFSHDVEQLFHRKDHTLRPQHQRGAAHQRREDLLHGGVEIDRGELQYPVRLLQTERLDREKVVVHNRLMLHHHALRPASGTGSVNHVSQGLGVHRRGRSRPRHGVDGSAVAVETNGTYVRGRQPGQQGLRCHHHGQPSVVHHVREPLVGVSRIQRHVGSAGLQNSEQSNQHLGRTLQTKPHAGLWPHAQAAQVVGKLIRPGVQLAVGERTPVRSVQHSSGLRSLRSLLLDPLVHRERRFNLPLGFVPGAQDELPLFL